jgi:hypothetical protein
MKSFKNYITENDNPLTLGRLLKIQDHDNSFDALVVRSQTAEGAVLLVLSTDHSDVGTLINSKSLSVDTVYKIINPNRIPVQNYFFQNSNPQPIKRVEYHDRKGIKEDLEEDVERSALLYFQSQYRQLKRRDDLNKKMNLIIEMLLTDFDDRRNRFIS